MLPRLSRGLRSPLRTDTVFANEITRQLAWLTERAKARNYRDADELAAKDLAEFMRLAAEWREHPSKSRMPVLLERLRSAAGGLSDRLSSAWQTLLSGGSLLLMLCLGAVLPRRPRRSSL
jgi:hypothetical protein